MSQDQITLILTSLQEIRGDIGELRGEVHGIHARLDKLNGAVARHEQALSDAKVSLAEHVSDCPMKDRMDVVEKSINSHVAEYSGVDRANKTWTDRLMPGVWMVAGILVSLVLMHGKDILTVIPTK